MFFPQFTDEVSSTILNRRERHVLGAGMGCSYGDVCTSRNNQLIGSQQLQRILAFDEAQATITVEPGVRIGDLVDFAQARGMQVPVVPGTGYVTIGGAIANDIHGKDSFSRGSFGNGVKSISLLRSDGAVHYLREGDPLFAATVGGLGLTGFILSAELQLLKTSRTHYQVERKLFRSLEEMFRIWPQQKDGSDLAVAWIDAALHSGNGFLSVASAVNGLHESDAKTDYRAASPASALPLTLVSRSSVLALNASIYFKNKLSPSVKIVAYHQFHFPLDRVENWNRFYGRSGLIQYQFVVPDAHAPAAFSEVFRLFDNTAPVCSLAVAKRFGNVPSRGTLSFPRQGFSLALDFPNVGDAVLNLMQRLDEIVRRHCGALYPAKDRRMSPEIFMMSYPQLPTFLPHRDEAFSSDLWERVSNDVD